MIQELSPTGPTALVQDARVMPAALPAGLTRTVRRPAPGTVDRTAGEAVRALVRQRTGRPAPNRAGATGRGDDHPRPPAQAGGPTAASAGPHRAVPVLRGRRRELAVLTGLLDGARRGEGGLLVVEGAPGSGKTRLLEEAGQAAVRRGLRVFHGGGDPQGRTVPLGPVLRAFSTGSDPLFDARALDRFAQLPNQGFWILQEIHERIERAAIDTPLLVLVDDVQWCDETSLLALRSLPGALAANPVVWVLAARTDELSGPARSTVSRLVRAGGRRARLGPLDDGAIRDLAHDTLGAVPDEAVLGLASQAEGRPLLLRELFEGLRDEGAVTVRSGRAHLTSTAIPQRFKESIRRRLSHLSDMARDLAEVAAVLGRSCSVDLMVELLDVQPGSLVEPLREVLASDILVETAGGLAFRHDLVREALSGLVPPARRRALQRRAFELRLARGASVAEGAEMLCETAEPGDLEAVGLLARAAAELAPRAPAAAAELSVRALRLLPGDDPARPRTIAETVSLLWLGGDHARALELAESAMREPGTLDAENEARLRLDLAGLASQRSFTEAVRQGRLGAAVEGAPLGIQAHTLALLALNLTRGGSLDDAHRTAVRAQELARRAGGSAAEVTALVAESIVAFMRADWRRAHAVSDRAVQLAREVDPAELPYKPGMWQVYLLGSCGLGQRALDEAEEGIRLAGRCGQAATMHFWSMGRARLLLDMGRLEEARAEAEGVVALAEEFGSAEFTDATVRYPLGVVAMHTGDRQGVRRAVRDAAGMMGDESRFVSRFGAWLAAQAAEWEGDSRRALDLMPRETELFDSVRPEFPVPFDPVDQPSFVRIALRAGDRRRAAEVVAAAVRRAEDDPAFTSLAAAAAHARGLLEEDAELLVRAVELYADCRRPIAVASACEDAGRVLLETSPDRAAGYLDRALRLYEECGAEWHAARAARRLARAGNRAKPAPRARNRAVSGWAGLSRGELKVVRLVAAGATNREVAERLFVSPHTVNTYVRRSFKKLGITSRVELVKIVREQDGVPVS